MVWRVIYHDAVYADLRQLGPQVARTILDVITQRIENGEPDKSGKALSGSLAGFRRIRTGSTRIVYRVNKKTSWHVHKFAARLVRETLRAIFSPLLILKKNYCRCTSPF